MKEFLELYAPIIAVTGAITALIGTPLGFFFGGKSAQKQALKKEVAATKQTDADANIRIAESYRTFVEDHNNQMDVLRLEIKESSKKSESLMNEIKELRTSNMNISENQTKILFLYTEEQRKSNELEKQNIVLTRKLKENEEKNNENEQKNLELTQKVEYLESQIALLTAAKNKTK